MGSQTCSGSAVTLTIVALETVRSSWWVLSYMCTLIFLVTLLFYSWRGLPQQSSPFDSLDCLLLPGVRCLFSSYTTSRHLWNAIFVLHGSFYLGLVPSRTQLLAACYWPCNVHVLPSKAVTWLLGLQHWLCVHSAVLQRLGYGLATWFWGWSIGGKAGVLSKPWCACSKEWCTRWNRAIVLSGRLDPPFHFQICRAGVCDGAAQVSEGLGCLQWFIMDRNRLWQYNGHWRRLVEQLGLRYVDLKTKHISCWGETTHNLLHINCVVGHKGWVISIEQFSDTISSAVVGARSWARLNSLPSVHVRMNTPLLSPSFIVSSTAVR